MSVKDFHSELKLQLGQQLFGLEETIDWLSIALIARGHVLLEGFPGSGKTSMARALAQCLGGDFGRIQCTADLMPSDMTGIRIFDETRGSFELVKGPLFSDVVIVDEINRTSPKTQSAMLEAMEERRITIDRESYPLKEDFFVIATQNPHEFEGTYPLPESQIDRFFLKLDVMYPTVDHEVAVLKTYGAVAPAALNTLSEMPKELLASAREEANQVAVSDAVYQYIVALAAATRAAPSVSLGLSTRGVLALLRCAKILAAREGYDYVSPDHIKASLAPVVRHRIVLTQEALFDGLDVGEVLTQITSNIEIPRE
ncbi:MAG: AAA family ATPase [Pseudomonadales bacterium]